MSNENSDTPSEESPEEDSRSGGTEEGVALPQADQRQGQEENRRDLPPGVSLPSSNPRYMSSNTRGDWNISSTGEAEPEAEHSDDSGHCESYKGNPDVDQDDRTSYAGSPRTMITKGVCPRDVTSRKVIATTDLQPDHGAADIEGNTRGVAEAIDTTIFPQQNLGPVDIERNTSGVAEAIDTTIIPQPNLGPVEKERNTSGLAEARDTTIFPQPNLGPEEIERNTSGLAKAIDTTIIPQPNLGPADIKGDSEMKDQTGRSSAEVRGNTDANPERVSVQKRSSQTDARQTQQQELLDTRKEASSRIGQKRLTVAESIERSKPSDNSEMPQKENQGREHEPPSKHMTTPGKHGVGGLSETLEQEQGTKASRGIRASKTTERVTCAEQGTRLGATSDSTGKVLRDRGGRHQTPEGHQGNTKDGPELQRADRPGGTGDLKKGGPMTWEGKLGGEIMRQQVPEVVHPREDPNTKEGGCVVAKQHGPVNTPESASGKCKERVRDGTANQRQDGRSNTEQLRDGQGGSGLDQQQTSEKTTGAEDAGRGVALVPGPTLANAEAVDTDPDGPCTSPVGYLLDSMEGGENNKTKEQIIYEMSSHPGSKMHTAYGLGAQYLGYEQWQLEQMWNSHVPACDNNVERVKNVLKALNSEGKTIRDVLLYFTHEHSKRLDIVRLILKIHQCDCCKKIGNNANI